MRKTNRTPLVLAVLATGLFAAGTAFAAPPAGDGAPRTERSHKMGEKFLAKVDANGDGNISQAEHDAVRAAHLAELDRDNDGYVTYDEQKAAMEARARAGFTKRHDKDGDGRVSIDELGDRGEGMFKRMDANADGMITQEEMRAGHRERRGDHGKRPAR